MKNQKIKNKFQKLIKRSSNKDFIRSALEMAKKSHKDQTRLSGESFINHPKRVALMLDEIGMGPETIAAALLHNSLDGKPISLQKIELKQIKKNLNEQVAFLIERVYDLKKIGTSLTNIKQQGILQEKKTENLRKMFLALAGDLRAVLIKLFSRADNLDTLGCFPKQKQKLYALETLSVFVPVAERLGIEKIKSKLADSSFYYLYPKKFNWLKKQLKRKYQAREKYLKAFTPHVKNVLTKKNINLVDINYRPKSYWSTYRKMIEQETPLDKIHDLVALRIIVETIKGCYRALDVIHKHYPPITEEIDDYIANPKQNGYRSLHTTVFCEDREITEMQIKTKRMHREAEYGICAHWAYKQSINLKKRKKDFAWTKKIPKILEDYKIDFFEDRIFAFTPKGDVFSLPKGSTPVDFAYAVHTDVGNKCESAKVNGKLISLSKPLENGDIVEIITKKRKKPSRRWLDFVKTGLARSNIRKILRKAGDILATPPPPQKAKKKIAKEEIKATPSDKTKKGAKVSLAGVKGTFLVRKAKCCSPKEGDKIKAYITQDRGASLHSPSCKNLQRLAKKHPHRVMNASWE